MAEKWEKLSRREDAERCKKGKEKQNEDEKEKKPRDIRGNRLRQQRRSGDIIRRG
jgi:hypothetical protein